MKKKIPDSPNIESGLAQLIKMAKLSAYLGYSSYLFFLLKTYIVDCGLVEAVLTNTIYLYSKQNNKAFSQFGLSPSMYSS